MRKRKHKKTKEDGMANGSITLRTGQKLPDNAQWTNRFQIKSEKSNKLYTIAQNKSGRWWGCSCPGWIFHKHCKHQQTLGIPGNYKPMEITVRENAPTVTQIAIEQPEVV